MALSKTFTFEEGTPNNAITATGDYAAVAGTITYNATAKHGSVACRAVGTGSYFRTNHATVEHGGSVYVRPVLVPSGAARLLVWMTSGDVFHGMLRLHSDGKFDLANAGATRVAASTMSWTAGTWYRLDYQITGTGTTHTATVRIFTDLEGTTPAETFSSASVSGGAGGSLGRVQVGCQGSGATAEFLIDTVRLYDTVEWAGPYLTSFAGSLGLSGSGTLGLSGSPAPVGGVGLSGSGSLAVPGRPAFTGAVTLGGGGTLSVAGSPSPIGTLGLSGAGTLVPSGAPSASGALSLSGAGSLEFTAAPSLVGVVTLGGAGDLSLSGEAAVEYEAAEEVTAAVRPLSSKTTVRPAVSTATARSPE